MKPIALFFGSNTGNTEISAKMIERELGKSLVDVYDVADDPVELMEQYDYLILGISTWDFGGLEPNWEDIWPDLEALNFEGKRVALFGQGDQFGFGEWYLDAMGDLYDTVAARGAEVVGLWPVEGYDFEGSRGVNAAGTHFLGLALDEDNQEELSESRIEQWCDQVLSQFGLTQQLATA